MIKLKCYKCDHEWNYGGKGQFYATCPNCYRKILIGKAIIENERDEN